MKLYLDCIPCFQKQALFATKNLHEQVRSEILKKVMLLLYNSDWNITPDELSQKVYSLIKQETGILDPYKIIKEESNRKALELYPQLKNKCRNIKEEKERLYTATKIAIAGNIIDFGPAVKFDLEKTIKDVLHGEVAVNDFNLLFEKIISANDLLYFADNAGEIALDKLFIEEMIAVRKKPFEKISFVIKGGPIINDAMLVDAQETGLDKLPKIIFLKIGNGEEGTGPNRRDEEVKGWIMEHELVISKGQGNYEGLSENQGICFLLMAKCPVVAGELGVKELDTIIKYQ